MDYNELFTREYPGGPQGRTVSVEGIYRAMDSVGTMDMEAFKKSGGAAAAARMMENLVLHPDEHDPASVTYWAKRGLIKEFHGEDTPIDWADFEARTGFHYRPDLHILPQNGVKKWTSFVPASAYRPENRGRKYPLLFVLHGGGNPVYTIDGWGYCDAAAEREWIVIVPSLELGEVILEILEEAKALWNIDESRIFVSGFSYGSINTNILAHTYPEIFAGAAPCGGFLTDGSYDIKPGGSAAVLRPDQAEPEVPYAGVSRIEELGVYMPAITVTGDKDRSRYPLRASLDPEQMCRYLNLWAGFNDCEPVRLEEALEEPAADASDAERHVGIPGCLSHTEVEDGIRYHIADRPSRDGVCRLRFVCEENIPHWPTPHMARLILDFFSHFSRDPVTHESIFRA